MAKKDKARIHNCKPTRKYRERTISYTPPPNVDCAGESTPGSERTINGLIRYNHNEVGNENSSFSGTDSYGNDIKAITFAEREPLYFRYNYVNEVDDYVDDEDQAYLDSITSSQYYYEQDVEEAEKLKHQVPRWENQCRPFITYDEEYFQHVFNWPTDHTVVTRKVCGFFEEVAVCACDGEEGGSSTTYTVATPCVNFTGTMELDKVESEVLWFDENYNYRKLSFSPTTGRINGDEGAGSTVPSDISASINISFQWDDDPDTEGVAVGTIGWNGSGVSFTQSGEEGSNSASVTLADGEYLMSLTRNAGGFDVTNNGTRIVLYDGGGSDTNARVDLNVTGTNGSGVTAKFDDKGNLVVKGTTNSSATDQQSNKTSYLTSKIGDPIIYHGGTDDNKIFFNYKPENLQGSSPIETTVNHVFNDPQNTTNSLTSSASGFTIEEISPADAGGGDDSTARKHYEVTSSGFNICSPADINISILSGLSASGLRDSNNVVVSRIKLLSNSKFKVWFKADNNVNTYMRSWKISLGEKSNSKSGSTSKPMKIGDTINGHTITNIVNYVVDVALKRTVAASSPKNQSQPGVSKDTFKDVYGGSDDGYSRTQGWLKLDTVADLAEDMQVFGPVDDSSISEGTKITAVDTAGNRIFISKPVRGDRPKSVRFADNSVNRISKHTLCYAEINGSGSDFTADGDYTSGAGIEITVRAGKGIINRSAVVGTYYSTGKKKLQYSPIFYAADAQCQEETDVDELGEYVLATTLWRDNYVISGHDFEDVYMLRKPTTEIPVIYQIASLFLGLTNSPIPRSLLKQFYRDYKRDSNIIRMYGVIGDFCKTELEGQKAAITFDSVCRNDVRLEYFQAYIPELELDDLDEGGNTIDEGVKDSCIRRTIEEVERQRQKQGAYDDFDQVVDRFEEIVANSTSQSSFLSEEYYNRLVGDQDSILNKIKSGTRNIKNSTPDTKIENLPPQVEGSDNSGRVNISDSYRELPPSMDRCKYFIEDLVISDDKFVNPVLDLAPETTINQPRLVFRSKPRLTWTGGSTTQTTTVTAGGSTSSIIITVNLDSEGYLDTITSSTGAVTAQASTYVPGTPSSGVEGQPGYNAGTSATGCTYSAGWRIGPKDARDNIYFGERAEQYGDGAYYEATNNSLPPQLRDLDYKDRSSDDDILPPIPTVYPRVLWERNVSYQQDFYKIFWFRLNELTELIGETLANFGNPYMDKPILAKIRRSIGSSDTEILVESTAGFLESGYLSIPKYQKKLVTDQTGNNTVYFSYSGEEIIYYDSKTDRKFMNCVREAVSSSSDQVQRISAREISKNIRYKIIHLGSTDWKKITDDITGEPAVGDVFVANKDGGNGSGEVEIFATNSENTPDADKKFGASDNPRETVISSYDKGFSVSQYWIDRIREV